MAAVQEPSVAVIGLGAQGLVTVKNLLEQGFRVTGFERQDYVGGIWHYSAQHHVSALRSTVVNVSRERACFTDFASHLARILTRARSRLTNISTTTPMPSSSGHISGCPPMCNPSSVTTSTIAGG
ncbi:hypothetical protein LTR11_012114 [Exophiala xenobiotica]|nr:hypothetical protein LTR11_012114 [Exophiala xenobiotica]KAK5427678.1 hypothetical protein LTR55_012502 [Exophiala xenobiotica]